jgi:uncharacterized membrane protein YqjE
MSLETEAGEQPSTGPAVNLFRSLTHFFASLIALLHTRLELLTTELREEVQRAVQLVILAFIALVAGMMGLFMLGLTVVFYFWETHRELTAILVTAFFIVIAAGAVLALVMKSRSSPLPLATTLAELKKDADQLRGSL